MAQKGQPSRHYTGTMAIAIKAIGILIPIICIIYIFNITSRYFNIVFHEAQFNALFFAGISVLTFLLVPATKKSSSNHLPWYDIILCIIAIIPCIYVLLNYESYYISQQRIWATPAEQVLFIVEVIAIFEAVRRTLGNPVLIVAILFLLHAKFSYLLPGLLGAPKMDLSRMATYIYLNESGIFGTVLGIAGTIIIIFVTFGRFLTSAGASNFFTSLAFSIAGRLRGGPAKVALISSAFMGTISGSAAANVGVTGIVTIPLMKRLGYKPHFAAAVETVASTGGAITPPVMAAVAFMIAGFTGISYGTVALSAILPAILYYVCLYFQLDFEAAKLNVSKLSKSDIPSFKNTITKGWQFLIPLIVLIVLLMVFDADPTRTAIYAIGVVVLVSWFRKDTRMGLRKILNAIVEGSESMITIAPICALAGIIMGSVSLTGLGVNISAVITELAGSSLLLVSILGFLAIYMSGMGVALIVIYIVMAVMLVPAFIDLGVPTLSAHMFILYAGASMFFTPPFAPAVYLACSIADAKMWQTAFQSMKLGIVCYLIPIVMIFKPGLMLIGSAGDVALAVVTSILGAYFLAIGLEGFLSTRIKWHQRVIFIIGGCFCFTPGLITDLIGIAIVVIPTILQINQWRMRRICLHKA